MKTAACMVVYSIIINHWLFAAFGSTLGVGKEGGGGVWISGFSYLELPVPAPTLSGSRLCVLFLLRNIAQFCDINLLIVCPGSSPLDYLIFRPLFSRLPHTSRPITSGFRTPCPPPYNNELTFSWPYIRFTAQTVEPRFNEVSRDWANRFVISRVRCIENLVITKLLENNQSVHYIGV